MILLRRSKNSTEIFSETGSKTPEGKRMILLCLRVFFAEEGLVLLYQINDAADHF